MDRRSNPETRERILKVSETLFAEHGFHATSMDRIAKAAKVNKALIYYYFESKQALITALYEGIIREVEEHVDRFTGSNPAQTTLPQQIREEIRFMLKRPGIISVMLMEALRGKSPDETLFRCAETGIAAEHDGGPPCPEPSREQQRRMVQEFFTGFLPMVGFVAMHQAFATYFHMDPDTLLDDFVASFEATHLAGHHANPDHPKGRAK